MKIEYFNKNLYDMDISVKEALAAVDEKQQHLIFKGAKLIESGSGNFDEEIINMLREAIVK